MPTVSVSDAAPEWLVACLCAGWCTTCEAYRAPLAALARQHPQVQFAWVDIEDHADALEAGGQPIPDIENFPTLLLLRQGQPVFFGTVLPHIAVLERLLLQAPDRPIHEPAVRQLALAVQQLAASGAVPV